MKVAQIGQKAFSPNIGGIERHVYEISKSLAKRGHKILFYTHQSKSSSKDKAETNMRLIPVPTLETKHLATPLYTILASFHSVFRKPDIIHYHGIGPAFFSIIPRLLSPNAKIVVTAHSQDYQHGKWGIVARTFLKLSEFVGCKIADEPITVSAAYKQELEKRYKRDINLIPNGTNTPLQRSARILRQFNLKSEEYILTVNRLVEHKEIHTLIKAFKQASNLNRKLVIVGPSTHTQKYIKRLHALAEGGEKIIFTGALKGKKLEALYQHAWLFVQPSRSEGLSTVILEAMAAKTPVLASDIKPNKFLIKNCGFLFETGNVNSLEESLEKIKNTSSEVLAEKKSTARQKVEKEFSWDKISKEVEKLYRQALAVKSQTSLSRRIYTKD